MSRIDEVLRDAHSRIYPTATVGSNVPVDGYFVPQAGCAEQARLAMTFRQTARARKRLRGVVERQWTLKPL